MRNDRSGRWRPLPLLAPLSLCLVGCGEQVSPAAPITVAEEPAATAAGTEAPRAVLVQDRFGVSRSQYDAPATLARLLEALDRRELQVFAVIDHAAAAEGVGAEMPFATLVIFGDPQAGTPLMQAVPLMAAELPLRALVYEQQGEVFVAVTGIDNLARRYPLDAQAEILGRVQRALNDIRAEVAAG